ncbi:peptidoglycan DD-metalloendopeptidase family protein [Flavobacterium sp. CBA20B-1]|uniref:peptidoglycan DD-metalloendopeptidase family protein n=1 Tax=unclassified Flavobacterium TaxID=196869 RepID=UPI0022247E7D|nr:MULTISPECIES: peptidoglycan DD-metalloendopeptidase family protein [unclassified Flavobacterium]WCM41093.1 peptidoglycan DD-metalloendopeptidase family protein [Flavobacterium sp. CBA20B-1]
MKRFQIILYITIVAVLFSCGKKESESEFAEVVKNEKEEAIPEFAYGFPLNEYHIERDTVERGDNLGMILARHNYDATEIHDIVSKVKDSFDVRKIKAGKTFTLLKSKDALSKLEILIYQPDNMGFQVIDFRDSIHAYTVNYPVSYKVRTIAGEIEGSLSESIQKEGLDPGLATALAKRFAWNVDFFKFKRGDQFALSVREKFINDSIYVGTEEILGAYFNYDGKDVYGFPYKQPGETETQFYDENGKQMRTMFLKSPLKYFTITSKFSKSRFHPVQKRFKAHNGTDYAAPHGTPIMTTAAGVVIETGRTSGNGNYVKVKHNNMYTTQYLHMSKILVRRGQRVNQGDIIGKVGSTGLATGPHVCYRFWKNGVQVDPLKQKLPTSLAMEQSDIAHFKAQIQPVKKAIDDKITEKFN